MIANIRKWLVLGVVLFGLSGVVQAQMKPEYDMGRMQMYFLHADESSGRRSNTADNRAHEQLLRGLIESGKIAAAGQVEQSGTLSDIILIKTEKPEEAHAIVAELPLVKAKVLRWEHLTWFAARAFIKPITKVESETRYVFGLLVSGPNNSHAPEEVKHIQAGHMAHISKMHETGKLAIAGPFATPGPRRGVFLFKLDSLEAAQALAADDPAVKAGRLKLETFFWTVPAGIFP